MLHNLKNRLSGHAIPWTWIGAVAIAMPLAASPIAFAQGQSASAGGSGHSTLTEEFGCIDVWNDAPPQNGPTCDEVDGVATLRIRSDHSFTIQAMADGFEPGHAVTLWVFDGTGAGGFAAGGLAGGKGQVAFSSNNCIHPEDPGPVNNGFVPGNAPECDLVDLAAENTAPDFFGEDWVGGLNVFLLDHGPWTPGNMEARWTTQGLFFTNASATFDLED